MTANNASKNHGAANPVFTDTITGFVLGQNLGSSGVSGAAKLTTTAAAPSSGSKAGPVPGRAASCGFAIPESARRAGLRERPEYIALQVGVTFSGR